MTSVRFSVSRRIGLGLGLLMVMPAAGQHQRVISQLNDHNTVSGTDEIKSYRTLFDAYLTLDPPPFEVGENFNLNTIHPGMSEWSEVSGWAESNAGMAQALLDCKDHNILGLPYGEEAVDSPYRQAGIMAQIAVDGSLRRNEFPYLDAVDTIAAFATAEVYRLLEASQTQEGLDLAVAHIFVLRQLTDRQFLQEKLHSIQLLVDALANLRDVFYDYTGDITPQQYVEIAKFELPFLRPDSKHLQIPEGDRIISAALLDEVFDHGEQADPEKFAATFGAIQSKESPLERFGAARRWRMIAPVHSSLTDSKNRLKLVYDDWWRRWRVKQYDLILESETQFDRTNPVRYAAVIYSMQNIEVIFGVRNQLVAGVSGTIMAAGLCAYRNELGTFPDNQEKLYGQYVRKISDIDPYDRAYGHLQFRRLDSRTALDTPDDRFWLDSGDCLLYAQGEDNQDNRGGNHSDDGGFGDLVFWPPVKAISRD